MSELKPYCHEVKYYECDRMGVTHHSNYIRFMEEARIDWMDQLGYGFERMEAEGIVSPVMAIECSYKRTTTFKDVIEISIKVASMSELKISFSYTMKVCGKLVCTASSTHCFLEAGRPVVLADRFPELHTAILSSVQSN
ncbi:MAG: acyl-CoA thioesterase [Bacteroidales bacterium]|nr:acyl-CoA thioesterase [Bacteroidales bacterium]MBR0083415.1 acyl-CoA thioesterase [Bacteroidales bacterium]MBR0291856.1 acyl-CoA thioesterase [Bacteroidales bacterium]